MPIEPPTAPSERLVPWVAGIVGVAVYAAWIHSYLYPADGFIGHDFGGTLPGWLDGVWWARTNGPWWPPWFTALGCGGIPSFPEPQSTYYSVPQWVAFVLDPLSTAWVCTVAFAAVGYAGTYRLTRDVWGASRFAATTAGVFFLYSDFHTRRMITGSFGFHPFTLVPLTAWVLLRARGWRVGRWYGGGSAVVAGGLIAYWLLGGLTTLMIPAALAVVALACVAPDPVATARRLVLRGLPAALLALGICASRLHASLAYMRFFKRDAYALPGFPDVGTAATFAAKALFWPSEAVTEQARPLLVNRMWSVDPQEWASGVGAVPLLLLGGGAALVAIAANRGAPPRPGRSQVVGGLVLAGLLALPVALLVYTPGWNTFLKSLPLIGQTSYPFRWVILVVPLVCIVAARVLDHPLVSPSLRPGLAVAASAGCIALHLVEPDAFYRVDGAFYNPRPVVRAWSAPTPTITTMVDYRTALATMSEFYGPNDLPTRGLCAIDCYAPIFGYREEDLPVGPLHPGPALEEHDGLLNVKNPACYVFPEENGCAPGDHFPVSRRADAEALLGWRPFPFVKSAGQHAADTVTGASVVLLALGLAATAAGRRRPA